MNQWFFSNLVGFFDLGLGGVYLALISLIYTLLVSYIYIQSNNNESSWSIILLLISCFMSIICFLSNNLVIFWLSYELSILPLLALIFLNSPYSERYLASWYLVGYLGLTSLPMLLIFFFIYLEMMNFNLVCLSGVNELYLVLLFLIFLTKVPYPPFHAWLPIVHAEASSLISMALSGYIMKLGLIGIFRFCWFSQNYFIFFVFIFICFCFSLGFFVNALNELDYKRWLAFLSLAHIQITGLGLLVCSTLNQNVIFLYSLGHGLSVLFLFYFFQVLSESGGTRNWLILCQFNNGFGFSIVFFLLGLLTASSFPVSLQFIVEVLLIEGVLKFNLLIIPFSIYLLFGGLLPLIFASFVIINNKYNTNVVSYNLLFFFMGFILLLLVFSGFIYLS
uniref:NADH-ubiquinone oxidoreductase chain 4 n=1 Tax=Lamellodiscus spari TaxID=330065 RepID=A0A346Q033_9PLAT|nr:NADH dehydrogenase subunit 4 [Lamellodiscus spari]